MSEQVFRITARCFVLLSSVLFTVSLNAQCPTADFTPLPPVCPGQNTNLQVSFTGQAPWTFDVFANGVFFGNFSTSDNPADIPINPMIPTFYSLENLQDPNCGGTGDTISVAIGIAPEATLFLMSQDTVCPGDSCSFQVQINGGNPPFVFTYAVDGVNQPPVTTNSNPHNFNLSFTQSSQITLVGIEADGCIGTATGSEDIVVTSGPSAVISGGGQICQGGNGTTITVILSGGGPYTFVYTADNVPEPPVTTSLDTFVINVNPSSGTIYRLQSVSNPNCTGSVSGTAIVFVFTPSTARLEGDSTFCNSAMTTLPVDFTGTGPFNLVYSINGVPQDTVETFDDPFLIPVDIDSTTTYTLISVQSPGCFGAVIGSATVTINYPPSYSNLEIICDPATNSYTVAFDVLNATPPLTVVSGSGAFTGNRFVSNPIPQAQDYAFVFRDSLNCGDVTVSGPTICNCISDAGAMDSLLIDACPGDTIEAVFLGGEILDTDDSLRFILHTLPGFPVGHIVAWNDEPVFLLSDTLLRDTVYYISAIAGDYLGGDSLDLNDICLQVATGTPVYLHQTPQASLGADIAACAGADVVIPVSFSGTAPYQISYTYAGQGPVTADSINANPFLLSLNSGAGGDFNLITVTDAYCPSASLDTLTINILGVPEIQNLDVICNLSNGTYHLEFDAVGGMSPYTVSGVTGSFSGGRFTSDPISATLPYSIALNDVNNCAQDTTSGVAACVCPTDAGTMPITLISLCPGDSTLVTPGGDQSLDSDDILRFILHTLPNDTLGTILATNTTPVFSFIPGSMQTGVLYYVSAVAGNDLGNGQIDLNDPCLSVSPGTPVRWNAAPTAVIGGNFDVCPGQQQLLGIQFTGQAPYTFTYAQNGAPTTVIAPQNNFAINTTLLQSAVITLVSVQDANCPGSVSGQAVITVHPVPQLGNVQVVCNPDNLTYFVEFDVLAGDLATMTFSGNPGGNYDPVTGHFVSNSLPLVTPYTIIGQDSRQCGSDTISGTENCSCSSFAGQIPGGALDICIGSPIVVPPANGFNFDAQDTLGYILYQAPLVLPQGVIASSSQPDFGVVAGLQAGKTYFVSAVVGNPSVNGNVNLGDPCLSVSNGIPVNIRALPTAVITGDTTVCIGSGYAFPVSFTGNAPFQFSYSINGGALQAPITAPQNSFLISINNLQQTQVIALAALQDQYCPGSVSGMVTINVQSAPEITLSGGGRICPGDSVALNIALQNADSCDVTVNSNAGNLIFTGVTDGFQFRVSPDMLTTYSLGAVNIFGNQCLLKSGGSATVESNPMTVQLQQSNFNGFGVSCAGTSDGSLEVDIAGGFSPTAILWEDGSAGLSRTGLNAGNYAVTVTDAANCTFTTEVVLSEPLPILFDFSVIEPTCYSDGKGAIVINSVDNAAGFVSAQINDEIPVLLQSVPQTLDGLPGGSYLLTLEDDNGCTSDTTVLINETGGIQIDLGPDLLIFQYDSVLLTPTITGNDAVRFTWSPVAGLSDPLNLSTWAAPATSTVYRLTVEDAIGCTATDQILVQVDKTNRVYFPNVIKPDAGGINGVFAVYGGAEVFLVRSLQIYDRWGGLVFEAENLQPNSAAGGWNGDWRGKQANPGVYIYQVEVEYRNGTTEIFSGDVSLVR